jgi:glutathione synthase/RimK-type ligase-like ATP-grasp enzyme
VRERHFEEATRAKARVALVTCAELRDLEPDDRLLLAPLADRRLRPDIVVWDDPAVDWAGYDLVVLRNPWDYVDRRDAFVAWAATVPRLVNPADVVAWNTDKRYLAELAAAGLPVVPTTFVAPGDTWAEPGAGEFVIKPLVGAGSRDSGRYDLGRPDERRLAAAHVDRLRAAGRTVMVQPYLAAVDTYGETALVFVGGAYSHAVRKGPMLTGPDSGDAGLYRPEHIIPRTPTAAEHDVARRVLAAVPGGAARLPYARVDLIPGPDGAPLLVELEVTEPSLFLGTADGAPERFADAVAACVAAGLRSSPPPAPR